MTLAIPKPNSPDSLFEELWLTQKGHVGRGTTRNAYELEGLDEYILKVSSTPSNFTNWAEIVAYHFNKDSTSLATIVSWSWSGRFLLMERLTPLEPGDLANFPFPDYLTDRKPENFGRSKSGDIKALDYASLKFPQPTSTRFT